MYCQISLLNLKPCPWVVVPQPPKEVVLGFMSIFLYLIFLLPDLPHTTSPLILIRKECCEGDTLDGTRAENAVLGWYQDIGTLLESRS